ncbi:MAG: aminotransferase [Amylibacter sp.]|jgi:aspartate/methionine/tyrosine aminotransferase|nr:aminotransferase [Amylibacter sp.]
MKIAPFAVEMWMNDWETKCELNLAETCVESLTIAELLALTGRNDDSLSELLTMKMTYGGIEGSDRLRNAITTLYANQNPENIVTTHGTIGANALIHQTLVERGDKVIAVVPTYQQHYSIPASIGADVHTLKLRADQDYLPDMDALAEMATPDTKLIAINNPNNPTGALMDRDQLMQIVEIARKADAWLLCDEVYRGTNQQGDGFAPAIADLYEKGISTASMSKAFSLAGLRLGWIAAPRALIEQVMIHRDYNTISVGMIDDHFAALALEHKDAVIGRSQRITRENLETLANWIDQEPLITWVKPRAGTTALLNYDLDIPSQDLCIEILKETGVMFTPGSALDMEGTLRIGFANTPSILKQGLARVSEFLAKRAR